jgi:hypothetical protein
MGNPPFGRPTAGVDPDGLRLPDGVRPRYPAGTGRGPSTARASTSGATAAGPRLFRAAATLPSRTPGQTGRLAGAKPPVATVSSARITCITALMSARCVNACGKLPRCRPVRGSISSAYSSSGLA